MKGYTVDYRERRQKQMRREMIVSYLLILVAVVFAAYFIVEFFCFTFVISGDSMNPSLKNGDKYLINRAAVKFRNPKKGDIVLFGTGSDHNRRYYVKRIMAEPGDTVEIKNGELFVNNHKAKLYSKERIIFAGLAEDRMTVETDSYFLMGDNFNNSDDSRDAGIGNVKRDDMIGTVSIRWI